MKSHASTFNSEIMADSTFSEAIPEYLNLYSTLSTQAGIKKKKYLEITPVVSIDNSSGAIQFQINVGENEMILPSGIRIMSGIDIRNVSTRTKAIAYIDSDADPTKKGPVKANALVPIEGLGHALFSDVVVYINDQKQDGGDAMYAYKGAIQNRLFTTIDQKKGSSELKGLDWKERQSFEDAFGGAEDVFYTKIGANVKAAKISDTIKALEKKDSHYLPFAKRFQAFQTKPVVHYIDEIYNAICQQPRPLPPGTKMTLVFTRNRPEFLLLNETAKPEDIDAYIHFEYCKLLVPVLVLEDNMAEQIRYPAFKDNIPFKYPMRKIDIQMVSKNGGMTDLSIENVNIQSGAYTPRRMFVGIVREAAFTGSFKLDPFNFAMYNVAEMTCKLGGQLSELPSLKCSPTDVELPVQYLLQTLDGEGLGGIECGITRENFCKRNALFAFDITGLAGVEFADCFIRDQKIPCGLNIRLSRPVNYDLAILIYKEYDYEEQIDKYGKLIEHSG